MPTKPMPPCRYPGCPELQAPGTHGYCHEHEKLWRKQDVARRGSARQRGYDRRYERARAWTLKHKPLCAICQLKGRLTAAEVTHHIKPLAEGGTNSAANLLPVCEDCHERLHGKHGKELLAKLDGATVSTSE